MSEPDSDSNRSVTSLADPSVVRERAPDIQRGNVIAGRYQVEAIIGKGGSGIVVRAFDRTAQMLVALKILRPDLAKDERWSQRFARELRLGRPIRHPNVCRIFDIGEADGHKFLTMELAEKGTLRDLIKSGAPLRPLAERMADAAAAIAGLAAIHEAGIVHRDVKPDNMLRMEDGRLALSDFGLATDLSNTGPVTIMVGTPHYMAPEVRGGEPATTRSDVWSLGVVLHEIFFGLRPERKSSRGHSGISKPPPPMVVTPVERAMLAMVEGCLSDDPVDRPGDAREAQKLFRAASSSPSSFRLARLPRAWALAVAALVGAVAVVAVALITTRNRPAVPPPAQWRGVSEAEPSGQPTDWRGTAKATARFVGHVHCFELVNDRTALVVWGAPRRAEMLDMTTGTRRPSTLDPETYALGCPHVSPSGKSVLFMGASPAGTREIRLSASPVGTDAKVIALGEDPIWTKTDDEFLYNIDPSHVALFAVPTMSYTLLPDPGLGGGQTIGDKAASSRSNTVAVLNVTERSTFAVTVYEGQPLAVRRTLGVPVVRSISFDAQDEVLLTEVRSPSFSSAAVVLNWRSASLRRVGRYSGFELVNAQNVNDTFAVVGRQRTRNAWRYQDGARTQVTSDGATYWADVAGPNALLVTRRSADGEFAIWYEQSGGSARQLTRGPNDTAGAMAPDGRQWAYADYNDKRIMLCAALDGPCRAIHEEALLPVWLRFSPSSRQLAYVTQAKMPQLTVISLADGKAHRIAAAHWECPPVWSSETTVWSLESERGRYIWSERDVTSGGSTGKRADIPARLEDQECELAVADPASPFFQRVQIKVEERAEIWRVPLGLAQ
jgi:serine/threonine-protein kinase